MCVHARARAHVRVRRFLCKQVRKTFQKCVCGCVHISLLRCERVCAHPHVHFSLEKMCGCLCTLGFLAEISFTPLSYHPGGCLGCPEKETRSRNYNLFVRSTVFQSKWNDVQKTYKNHQNPVKSYCVLGYFQSLFNFGWKTVAQTN